jgi:hypothetical protein
MRYRIEFGRSIENRLKAQKFRQKVFRDTQTGLDEDKFDDLSDHCLIFDQKRDDKLVFGSIHNLPISNGFDERSTSFVKS